MAKYDQKEDKGFKKRQSDIMRLKKLKEKRGHKEHKHAQRRELAEKQKRARAIRMLKEKSRKRVQEDSAGQCAVLGAELRRIAAQQAPSAEWMGLDNAALIFPASETAQRQNMFRLSATLKSPVDPIALQRALNTLVGRYPTMCSSMKAGFFWYYLEHSNTPLVAEQETRFPCRNIRSNSRNALVRVLYYKNEIAVEFFHVATDGTGGLCFLNSLIGAYLSQKDVPLHDKTNYLNPLDKPKIEELADSYQQYADYTLGNPQKEPRAYKIKGDRLSSNALIVIKGVCDAKQINDIAKARGVTVGQLTTACLMWAVEQDKRFSLSRDKRPVVISVPVNLRKLHPSKTVRNFSQIMNIVGDNETDFEKILQNVKNQFESKYNDAYFKRFVNYNIKAQRNPALKFTPLVLKLPALKIALKRHSDDIISTAITNLGKAGAPEDFKQHVVRYDMMLGPQSYAVTAAAAISFNGVSVFTFTRTVKQCNIERLFFCKLAECGVNVAVETNYSL